jgi:hypothetical protein
MPTKKENDRSFTIESSSTPYSGGRYIAQSALHAAKHAARILFRPEHAKDATSVTFSLRETTKGSDKKGYSYKATLTKRTKPLVWKVKDASGKVKELQSLYEIKVLAA